MHHLSVNGLWVVALESTVTALSGLQAATDSGNPGTAAKALGTDFHLLTRAGKLPWGAMCEVVGTRWLSPWTWIPLIFREERNGGGSTRGRFLCSQTGFSCLHLSPHQLLPETGFSWQKVETNGWPFFLAHWHPKLKLMDIQNDQMHRGHFLS